MDAIEAIHSRRSIRTYTAQPVDRELIEALVWDAAQAPPPFAGQVPWTFNVATASSTQFRHFVNSLRNEKVREFKLRKLVISTET